MEYKVAIEISNLITKVKCFENQNAWTEAQITLLQHGIILFKNPNFPLAACIIIQVQEFDETNINKSLRRTNRHLLAHCDQVLIQKIDPQVDTTQVQNQQVYVYKDRWQEDPYKLQTWVPLTQYTTKL